LDSINSAFSKAIGFPLFLFILLSTAFFAEGQSQIYPPTQGNVFAEDSGVRSTRARAWQPPQTSTVVSRLRTERYFFTEGLGLHHVLLGEDEFAVAARLGQPIHRNYAYPETLEYMVDGWRIVATCQGGVVRRLKLFPLQTGDLESALGVFPGSMQPIAEDFIRHYKTTQLFTLPDAVHIYSRGVSYYWVASSDSMKLTAIEVYAPTRSLPKNR